MPGEQEHHISSVPVSYTHLWQESAGGAAADLREQKPGERRLYSTGMWTDADGSALLKEIEIIAIKNDFQAKVKAHVDKNQKEYLLREQMKVCLLYTSGIAPASDLASSSGVHFR